MIISRPPMTTFTQKAPGRKKHTLSQDFHRREKRTWKTCHHP
ncbi:MAG: hypothetical protein ACK51L_04775 [bacterium]